MEERAVYVKISGVTKSFGDLEVLSNIDLEIQGGKILCVLGPSGCGKTTLLNIIARMIIPDGGLLEGLEPHSVSYVFQEPRLLPWKTVKANVEFVLRGRKVSGRRSEEVERCLELVDLIDFQHSFPAALSGGMKQRVAIARAFAYPSHLLLMDEPFRALDLKLKLQLIRAFMDIWWSDRRAVVFVTHDIPEAVLLGDEIVVLSERPARVVSKLQNALPKSSRTLENMQLLALEKRLYRLLVSELPGPVNG